MTNAYALDMSIECSRFEFVEKGTEHHGTVNTRKESNCRASRHKEHNWHTNIKLGDCSKKHLKLFVEKTQLCRVQTLKR